MKTIEVACVACDWSGRRKSIGTKPCPQCGGEVRKLRHALAARRERMGRHRCGHAATVPWWRKPHLEDCRACRDRGLAPAPRHLEIRVVTTGRLLVYAIPPGMQALDQSRPKRRRRRMLGARAR